MSAMEHNADFAAPNRASVSDVVQRLSAVLPALALAAVVVVIWEAAVRLFNIPQFYFPDNTLGDSKFGQVTSTNTGSERHIQFQLRLQF